METIFRNKFVEINIDKSENYSEVIYFATTAQMTDEDYKQIVLKGIELGMEFQQYFSKLICDYRNFLFPVRPEIQLWAANEMLKVKPQTETKVANIVSSDLIANLSIEQTVEEVETATNTKSNLQYFDDIETAKKWLFE